MGPSSTHYYGDLVRKLFLGGAIGMLLLLPFLTKYIPVSMYASLLLVLVLSIIAGLTNPRQFYFAVLDVLISIGGVIAFGYYAIEAYQRYSFTNLYFVANEVLSILFLVSLYFSTKTLRGFYLK